MFKIVRKSVFAVMALAMVVAAPIAPDVAKPDQVAAWPFACPPAC